MYERYPPPGTVISVLVGLVRHFGIVTDIWQAHKPMVISSSWRRGGTHEEPWDVFTGGRVPKVEPLMGRFHPLEVIERARAMSGRPWGVFSNCEHFVRRALGLKVESPQLRAVGTAAIVIAGIVLISRTGKT